MEKLVIANTLPEAYHKALSTLFYYGQECDCADWGQKQKEISMTMQVLDPTAEPRISKLFIGGFRELQQYEMEMTEGILDFEVERGKWAYTYHQRMGEQIDFVIGELFRNPSSRRAVIDVRTPADAESNEPACLQHLQYTIRNGKLNCFVLFRSNDACKATFMNAFALIRLQEWIAEALGVKVGSYTHRANSFHCYEKDYELLKGYVERMEHGKLEDLTYHYAGDWLDLMEDERESILAEVQELYERG